MKNQTDHELIDICTAVLEKNEDLETMTIDPPFYTTDMVIDDSFILKVYKKLNDLKIIPRWIDINDTPWWKAFVGENFIEHTVPMFKDSNEDGWTVTKHEIYYHKGDKKVLIIPYYILNRYDDIIHKVLPTAENLLLSATMSGLTGTISDAAYHRSKMK